jgi:hypothetical protein
VGVFLARTIAGAQAALLARSDATDVVASRSNGMAWGRLISAAASASLPLNGIDRRQRPVPASWPGLGPAGEPVRACSSGG